MSVEAPLLHFLQHGKHRLGDRYFVIRVVDVAHLEMLPRHIPYHAIEIDFLQAASRISLIRTPVKTTNSTASDTVV